MFQTDLILFLQSLSCEVLTFLMRWVSHTGVPEFYIPALVVVTFGFSLRRGFLLIQAILACAVATDVLKHGFGLPRPWHVESAVALLEADAANPTPFVGQGAESFFSLPGREAVDFYRSQAGTSFGLPSGHTSSAVTFWGGLACLFQRPAAVAAAAAMIALMPLSRMYLGMHFLGDILGGLALGAALVWAVRKAGRRAEGLREVFSGAGTVAAWGPRSTGFWALFLLPFAILLLPGARAEHAGYLLGLNAGFLLLARGMPLAPGADAASPLQRFGRILLALGLFVAVFLAVDAAEGAFGNARAQMALFEMIRGALAVFAMFWGTIALGVKLGLFRESATRG